MGGILEVAVSEYLNAVGPEDEAVLVALNAALATLPALDWEEAPWPDAVWVVGQDGDEDLEAVAAFGRYGLESFWFDFREEAYQGYPLPGADPIGSPPWWSGVAEVASLADLNGDGRADLLLSSELRGASATIYYLDAFTWRDSGPENVLEWPVEYWAEPSSWALCDGVAGQEFVVTCPAFGIYDAKLLLHPIQTRIYAWDGQRFALTETSLPEPTRVPDQFNRAEAAFERGDYVAATAGFLAVTTGLLEDDERLEVDWAGFAYFRLRQIEVLRGEPEANGYLAAVVERGGAVGELAANFGRALSDRTVLDAFGGLQRSELAAQVYQGTAEGLGYIGITGPRVLVVGKGMEWVMDRWVVDGRWSAREELTRAAAYDLGPHSLADLDVDGRPLNGGCWSRGMRGTGRCD
jgi:hypothetical protein